MSDEIDDDETEITIEVGPNYVFVIGPGGGKSQIAGNVMALLLDRDEAVAQAAMLSRERLH